MNDSQPETPPGPAPAGPEKDQITASALGYGNGVAGCTAALFWVKAISERDLLLVVIMALSTAMLVSFFRAGLDSVQLMAKDDGARERELESIFRNSSRFAAIQFMVMFKMFILG